MYIERNIAAGDHLLLTSEAFIKSINICNTGSSVAEISLYKTKDGSSARYYFVKQVSLNEKNTFLGEEIGITTGDRFYVELVGGVCSVILDYQ